MHVTRRHFLRSTAAVLGASSLSRAASAEAFSFVLLGDLHYDKLFAPAEVCFALTGANS